MENQTNDGGEIQPVTQQEVQQEAKQEPPKAKSRGRPVKIGIWVLVVCVVFFKLDCFIWGLLGKPAWTMACAILYLFPVALLWIAYFLFRVIVKLVRWQKARLWTKPLTYTGLLILIFICLAPMGVPGSIPHRLGFYFWAKAQHIDIPAVVAWAENFQPTLENSNDDPNRDYVVVKLESLPPSIQKLASRNYLNGMYYGSSDMGPTVSYIKRDKALELFWGSTFMGHWGITIGRNVASKPSINDNLVINNDAFVWERE